jgi:hypothetical protein
MNKCKGFIDPYSLGFIVLLLGGLIIVPAELDKSAESKASEEQPLSLEGIQNSSDNQ